MRFVGSEFPNQGLNPEPLAMKAPSPNHWHACMFSCFSCA